MKYKLLKDLPWADKGCEWELITKTSESHVLKSINFLLNEDVLWFSFPSDTFSKWFEEVDERWKPETGTEYFHVYMGSQNIGITGCAWGDWKERDEFLFSIGNLFKTSEHAICVGTQIKALLKEFHKNNP